jgi:hypothetical protein
VFVCLFDVNPLCAHKPEVKSASWNLHKCAAVFQAAKKTLIIYFQTKIPPQNAASKSHVVLWVCYSHTKKCFSSSRDSKETGVKGSQLGHTGVIVLPRGDNGGLRRKLPGFFEPHLFGTTLHHSIPVKYLAVVLDSWLTWRVAHGC